jgi:ABC-2 type transport system permease protein
MLRLIGNEIFKMTRKPRTYLGFAAFLVIDILLLLGLRYGGIEGIIQNGVGGRGIQMVGSPINAVFFAWLVVGSPFSFAIVSVWIPFFSSIVSGEIMAGEHSDGTMRALLTRPINRLSLLWAKLIACMLYCILLVFFLGTVAYLFGWIWFGRGGLSATGTMMQPMLVWYPESEGLHRLVLSYLMTTLFATTVACIALFISVWLNNAVGAIGGTMLLTFMLAILGEIPYFHVVKPYLYTSYVFMGQKMFLDPIPTADIHQGLITLGIYIISFVALSAFIFRRKDILA